MTVSKTIRLGSTPSRHTKPGGLHTSPLGNTLIALPLGWLNQSGASKA
ncbi:MAG: hypothetical protein LKI21_04420 [Bifidobacterium crudilactis]|nr:hypothetical protein [Bifidobacterium crudilactis]